MRGAAFPLWTLWGGEQGLLQGFGTGLKALVCRILGSRVHFPEDELDGWARPQLEGARS